jgi:hypothetical protein
MRAIGLPGPSVTLHLVISIDFFKSMVIRDNVKKWGYHAAI